MNPSEPNKSNLPPPGHELLAPPAPFSLDEVSVAPLAPLPLEGQRRATQNEPRTTSRSRTLTIALGLILAAIVVAVFYRALDYKLLTWDDDQHVTENEYFNPLTWLNVLHFWGYEHIFMYIPVSYNFYALEVWIAGWFPSADPADKFNPAVFHAGGLLLHLGCTLWAYRLMNRLVVHAPAAFFGAALFAIHPLQVESACWVGETRGTLCTFFSFAALWCYLNYVGVDPERGIFADAPYEPPAHRRRDAVFGFLFFALALLSKPSAASLPVLVLLIDVVLLRHDWKRSLLRLAPWFAAGLAIMLLTKHYQADDTIDPVMIKAWYLRPFVAGDAYAFYLGKLFRPFDLAFDYGRNPHVAGESPYFYRLWLAPLLPLVAALALPRRRIWLGCYGFFLLALAPVSGIIPFIYQNISTVADRYMYVPMFGLGLLLAATLAVCRRPVVAMALTAVALGFCTQRSIEQCATWQDDDTLYLNGLRVNPASYMSHLNLGNRYREAGHFESALAEYRRVIEIRPHHAWAYVHMGTCHATLGRYDLAVRDFQTALNIDPHMQAPLFGLGDIAELHGDLDGAEQWYRDAAKFDFERKSYDREPAPHVRLGRFLLQRSAAATGPAKERYEQESIACFEEALKLKPDGAGTYRIYGRSLAGAGRLIEAAQQLERAAELAPDDSQTLTDLGSCYLQQGKVALALQTCEQAVRKDPNLLEARTNRALALAAAGKPEAARMEYEKALELVPRGTERATELRTAMEALR